LLNGDIVGRWGTGMSFFANLRNRVFGGSDGASMSGVWRVTDISVQHPFGRYLGNAG
jgi:hypothetical protein